MFLFIQVLDDDDQSPSQFHIPDEMSRVVNVQQLASSSAERRTITPVASVASVLQNPPDSSPSAQPSMAESPPGSTSDQPKRTESIVAVPAPARRRTKLIAINVRRQTLSAVPRVQKTVRFAPSPTRGIEYFIDETAEARPDRRPHLWTEELAGGVATPHQLEAESEEPFVAGLLRGYDFSARELGGFVATSTSATGGGAELTTKFAEERAALMIFFADLLAAAPVLHLNALDRSPTPATNPDLKSVPDVDMQEV